MFSLRTLLAKCIVGGLGFGIAKEWVVDATVLSSVFLLSFFEDEIHIYSRLFGLGLGLGGLGLGRNGRGVLFGSVGFGLSGRRGRIWV